jgi:hypothetical protein
LRRGIGHGVYLDALAPPLTNAVPEIEQGGKAAASAGDDLFHGWVSFLLYVQEHVETFTCQWPFMACNCSA